MKVYNYHPESFILTSIEEAAEDPLRPDEYILPDYSTTVIPPEITDKQYLVYNETDKEWVIKDYPRPPYYELRRRNYPSIFDYIDGIVKNDQVQINKYIEQCNAVKKAFPRPELDYEI